MKPKRSLLLSVLPLVFSCGAAPPPSKTADAESMPESDSPDRNDELSPLDSGDAMDATSPAPHRCAGGMCTPCGDALCPQGFICEEATATCSWLPECTADFDCGCVEQHFDTCSCKVRDQGLYVTCTP